MADTKPQPGTVGWIDLTTLEARERLEFYRRVVGWEVGEVAMGEYSDFTVHAEVGGPAMAGICHARGANAGVPTDLWIPYFVVVDHDAAVDAAFAAGGVRVHGPVEIPGSGRFTILRDPGGAAFALGQFD